MDVYEIDGASARGVDEIRVLRESVRTLPVAGNKKVYIIDEVHMLTKEAFNALLKLWRNLRPMYSLSLPPQNLPRFRLQFYPAASGMNSTVFL